MTEKNLDAAIKYLKMLHRHDKYWTTISNLSEWTPSRKTVFVNTLPYESCNVISVGNGTEYYNVNTLTDISNLSLFDTKKHCAIYCAHSECGAAKKAMHKEHEKILRHCSTVDYLVGGVRDMMLSLIHI